MYFRNERNSPKIIRNFGTPSQNFRYPCSRSKMFEECLFERMPRYEAFWDAKLLTCPWRSCLEERWPEGAGCIYVFQYRVH
jgi:hypothetical protein